VPPPAEFDEWLRRDEFSVRRRVSRLTTRRAPRKHPKHPNLRRWYHGAHPWPLQWGGLEIQAAHFNAHQTINLSIQKRAENAIRRAVTAVRGSGYQLYVTTSVTKYPELRLLRQYTVSMTVYHPALDATKWLGEFTIEQSLLDAQREALEHGQLLSHTKDGMTLSYNGKSVVIRTKNLIAFPVDDVKLLAKVEELADALRTKGDRGTRSRTAGPRTTKARTPKTTSKGKGRPKGKTAKGRATTRPKQKAKPKPKLKPGPKPRAKPKPAAPPKPTPTTPPDPVPPPPVGAQTGPAPTGQPEPAPPTKTGPGPPRQPRFTGRPGVRAAGNVAFAVAAHFINAWFEQRDFEEEWSKIAPDVEYLSVRAEEANEGELGKFRYGTDKSYQLYWKIEFWAIFDPIYEAGLDRLAARSVSIERYRGADDFPTHPGWSGPADGYFPEYPELGEGQAPPASRKTLRFLGYPGRVGTVFAPMFKSADEITSGVWDAADGVDGLAKTSANNYFPTEERRDYIRDYRVYTERFPDSQAAEIYATHLADRTFQLVLVGLGLKPWDPFVPEIWEWEPDRPQIRAFMAEVKWLPDVLGHFRRRYFHDELQREIQNNICGPKSQPRYRPSFRDEFDDEARGLGRGADWRERVRAERMFWQLEQDE
jgi:hypothetical protein